MWDCSDLYTINGHGQRQFISGNNRGKHVLAHKLEQADQKFAVLKFELENNKSVLSGSNYERQLGAGLSGTQYSRFQS